MMRLKSLRLLVLLFALGGFAHADTTFDLSGPPLEVKVTRGGKTLPISQVPNLQVGDRLWLHPDFPEEQTARYLLVATFLRGATNPPPDAWFISAKTWNKQVRDEGIYVTVPPGAEQILLFLAPETGGDFTTLRTNVRARPGSFVRASQDLNQANLDRSRLDTYLNAVTQISISDPDALKDRTKLLARSLNIKLDSACFQKPAVQQLSCLTQDQAGLVLDDGHTESMVATLTSGASADLIGQLSATSMAGAGAYSPYVGAIVDVVRIMNGIHTAQYQYIPAIAGMDKDQLNLKLNNPPSFSNPKSVLTVGLPAITAPQLPPLHAINSSEVFCLGSPSLVLPVDGAPLVYSTQLGHDFVLHIEEKNGTNIDLPARPDPSRGGFVIDTHAATLAGIDSEVTGTLRGYWGFQAFDGPSFQLASAHPTEWALLDEGKNSLVVGQQQTLYLEASDAACVDAVTAKDQAGKSLQTSYKLIKPNELEVQAQLQDASPGTLTLLLKQAGLTKQDQVHVQTYPEAAHFTSFNIHAGDPNGELEGTRLDQVLKLELQGVAFSPAGLKHSGGQEILAMTASGPVKAQGGATVVAHVALKDGRQMELPVTVEQPRPKVTLISKSVDVGQTAAPSPIHLANQDELPQDSTVTFVLRADIPDNWTRDEKIEVATTDNTVHAMLTVEDGSLTLQDTSTVLATLNPLKSFGPSAFGPLQFRPVDETGTEGDWQPLGNLVRIPTLKEIHCPSSPERQCTLIGSNLFLLDSVSSSLTFRYPVSVPLGFANSELNVPRPNGTLLYIKLRDDPKAVNTVALPVLPE